MNIFITLLGIVADWATTVGLVAAIAFCFSAETTVLAATGVWLVTILLRGVLHDKD